MKKLCLISMSLFIILFVSGCSSSFNNYKEDNGNDSWTATYEKFDGHRQREIIISGENEVTFTIEIVTNSGSLGLSITNESGKSFYTGKELPSASFGIIVDSGGKYIIRFDADNHNGGFNIKW